MEGGCVMFDPIKECPNCHFRFPTEYARTVHICEATPKESDDKILAFLKKAKEEKDGD